MALPFVYSSNTKAKASEMNTNLTYVDYTAIANNKKINLSNVAGTDNASIYKDTSDNLIISAGSLAGVISIQAVSRTEFLAAKPVRFYDATNTNYVEIYQDTNGRIRNVGGGDLILDAASNIVRTLAGNSLQVVDSGGTKTGTLAHNGTYTTLTDSGGSGLYLDPGTDGDKLIFARMPRRNHSSNTYVNSFIQRGWAYVEGDGASSSRSYTITFPVAFSSGNIAVFVQYAGSTGSTPTAENSEASSVDTNIRMLQTNDITTTGFQAWIVHDAGGAFGSGTYYIIHWMAIGPA